MAGQDEIRLTKDDFTGLIKQLTVHQTLIEKLTEDIKEVSEVLKVVNAKLEDKVNKKNGYEDLVQSVKTLEKKIDSLDRQQTSVKSSSKAYTIISAFLISFNLGIIGWLYTLNKLLLDIVNMVK